MKKVSLIIILISFLGLYTFAQTKVVEAHPKTGYIDFMMLLKKSTPKYQSMDLAAVLYQ